MSRRGRNRPRILRRTSDDLNVPAQSWTFLANGARAR